LCSWLPPHLGPLVRIFHQFACLRVDDFGQLLAVRLLVVACKNNASGSKRKKKKEQKMK